MVAALAGGASFLLSELGWLRVGFSWSERFEILPAIGRALHASHPDLTLLTEEMWNARMLPALFICWKR